VIVEFVSSGKDDGLAIFLVFAFRNSEGEQDLSGSVV
jgi:hypothetical protein